MFTVDTEPDWGMSGHRGVKEVLPRVLDLCDRRGIVATFFVTAGLLDECRKELAAIGPQHEIASHGLTHRRLDRVSRDELRRELRESRSLLEGLGRKVEGVRAPFFATPPDWIEEALAAGYRYDASAGSLVPSLRNRRLQRSRELSGPMPELGVSTFLDGLTPCCLTYLRLYHPLGLRMVPRAPRMFYLHLHEFLPRETAAGLSPWVRLVLTRNCGDRAWRILDRALDRMSNECITCSDFAQGMRTNV
jgi:hypothetical protein